MFIGTLIYGLINSAVLIVVAMGFNLTFGISGLANFAYGAFYLLAGYTSWICLYLLGLPYLLSILIAVFFNALLGAVTYRFILLRVRGQLMSEVIVTFAVGLAMLELFRYLGFIGYKYSIPVFFKGSFLILGTYVDIQRLLIIIIGAFLVLCLWVLIHHTRVGLSFRGMAQNERTALSLGISTDRMATLSVSFGAGLAAIAAIIILPLGTISVVEGYDVLISALIVCIIGGLGSISGVVLGSLIIGFSQRFVDSYLSSHWTMIVGLVFMLFVLLVKPSGLLGKQKELEERI